MLNSIIFKIVIFIVGFFLFSFYGIFFVAAVVNLPDSWFGFLYSFFGLSSAILCFVYCFKQNKLFLVVIVPAFILMIITYFNK
jgi:hypothetical protein